MIKTFITIFRIPELRNKFLFTLALLCIYRVGFHVPLPGINQEALKAHFKQLTGEGAGAAGRLVEYVGLFTGGNLGQATLFGLGIMPYISASIIFQLLTTVIPALEKLQKEGEVGRQKINEYTRYATVGLCLIQSLVFLSYLTSAGGGGAREELVYLQYRHAASFWMMGVLGLTCGTMFMMWLGEQIDHYGLGNGVSLIIMAGIVARLPAAIGQVVSQMRTGDMNTGAVLFLLASFVFVVAGSILITQGQRRIPIQQAKMTRGRRVYGGQRQYLPLRVNHGGVMPIIFASTLMLLPHFVFERVGRVWINTFTTGLAQAFQPGEYVYELFYIGLIFLFAYFWTTVQFQPKEMANQLRDYGSFIPGLRPGRRTADYLEQVMGRITYAGAAFLSVIAVIPSVVASWMHVPYAVSAFLGGTGLLIMVSVGLDLIQRLEANLIMRNYSGFLGDRKAKIKGAYA